MAPPKKDVCKRGHDLTDPANVRQCYTKDGRKNGRMCVLCRKGPEYKEKDNERHRRSYWERLFMEALLETQPPTKED